MAIDLTGRVAIVTGAGGGLGRAHAMLLAKRGARIVVNDLGLARDGPGAATSTAESVVAEIRAAGGEAVADGSSVTDFDAVQAMVDAAKDRWGSVDILVNNAGILRDKSFAKMTLDDFRLVLDVHLMGSFNCTKAVWEIMRAQKYGRIVMSTSSSGLFGNCGQSNYSAAKLGVVGLMQTLGIEGAKSNVRVNCLAPTAGPRMLEGLMPQEMLDLLAPDAVSPALLALVAEDAPNRIILCAGAGGVEQAHITITRGIFVGRAADAAEEILSRLPAIGDRAHAETMENAMGQGELEIEKARAARSLSIGSVQHA
jgi:NAD(P)-dependent dehydrogenase (short-subunit alcohol dehydrogenase family)